MTPTGGAGQLIDGNRIPGSPENKLAFSLIYTLEFTPGSLTIAPSYFWRDDTYSSMFTRRMEGRGIRSDGCSRYLDRCAGSLQPDWFLRNALDDEGLSGGCDSAWGTGFAVSSLTPPRQYGLEVQFRFGK